jgi:multicomponent Na+:H+ antiporter subunit G
MIEIVSSIFILLGCIFVFIAALGIVRFTDLHSRLHASTKATSFGLMLILIGVSLHYLLIMVVVKAVLVLLFIYLTAPLAAHSISSSSKNELF